MLTTTLYDDTMMMSYKLVMKERTDTMARNKNDELSRVSINLPNNIIDRVKKYADNLGINTTSAYIVLLNQALEQKDMLANMPMLFSMFSELKAMEEQKKLDTK